MADQKQVKILKQGAEAWNKWRHDNPDVIIDLQTAILDGANLTGADLSRANLQRADLRQAILMIANLSAADLRRADLWAAELQRVSLTEANLTGANLQRADLRQAHLSRADLRGAHLSRADLRQAHLSRADLTGADLSGADLSRADLGQADLGQAHLSDANLRGANLTGADLRQAHLSDANLRGANLTGADLRQAHLSDANLRGANLTGADLTGSLIGFTIFGDNDLSEVIGLEKVRHVSRSTVGTDTIRKSKGKLPLEFLRGCGLTDLEIESVKLATLGLDSEQVTQITYEIYRLYGNQPIQFYSCFISYNSKDHKFAQRLHDNLQNNGVRCWFAPEDLKIGDEFRHTIGKEIRIRDKLLIILSKNSIRSEWVGDEVEKALAEEKEQGTHKLFPIRLDNAVLKAKDDWAEKIRLRRHIGDFSNWRDVSQYKNALDRLLRDLKTQ